MYERLIDTYSDFLTTSDVLELFTGLYERVRNNRSKASNLCSVTPATTYGWERGVKYIKTPIKKQVLSACIDIDVEFTLELLLKRVYDRVINLSIRLIRKHYTHILNSNRDDFLILHNNFLNIRKRYSGIYNQEFYDEMNNMRNQIKEKSRNLGFSLPKRALNEISQKELVNILKIIKIRCNLNDSLLQEISEEFDINFELQRDNYERLKRIVEVITDD